MWQTAAIGVLVIVVGLIFLLLWDPFGGERTGTDEGRNPGMVGSTEDLPASEDYVGVWLRPETEIGTVLARHGLEATAVLFAQETEGYYVIEVGDDDIDSVISGLKGDASLYDAGPVHEEAAPTEEGTATP